MATADEMVSPNVTSSSELAMTPPPPKVTRSILFQNGSSLIELASSSESNGRLAITFAPPELCDVNGFGYFEQQLTAAGFDVLAIKQVANAGYSDLTLDMIAEACGALPHYNSRVILGADAGATAALRLFSSFAGVKILALSPDMAYDYTLALPVQAEISLLFDPTQPTEMDNLRAAKPHFSRARIVRLPHLGMPTRYALEESGTLIAFMSALADNEVFDANQHFRKNRNASAIALMILGNRALQRGHYATAQTILERAYAIDHRHGAGISYCQALRLGGKQEAAAQFMSTIVEREPDNAHLWAALSFFEEMAGQLEQSLVSTRRAIQMLPEFEVFQVAERRLLNQLYDDLKMKQKMTEAALNKARAEFALIGGTGPTEFSWKRMVAFAGAVALILVILSSVAIIFRLV